MQTIRLALIGASTCAAGLGMALLLTSCTNSAARNVTDVYAASCASCHGVDLNGGSARSLVDGVWEFGADDDSVARMISVGNTNRGMPGFQAGLTEAEIRALVVFIREKTAQFEAQTNRFAKPIEGEVVASEWHNFRLHVVAENLDTPWSLAFLPDEKILVTELPGRLRVIEKGQLRSAAVAGTPVVRAKGQGGLMDVALHPDYARNGWIYLAYGEAATNQNQEVGMTTIVRGKLQGNQWTENQVIFRAAPESFLPTTHHYGCRLTFDDAGHLFFSIGERGVKEHAQDLTRPNGKVHRLHDDGRIPADNPFVGQSNAVASIWSYGNRNPQGLVFHRQAHELWETEHGPRGGDELNLIQRGRNYGWPLITHGMDYNGTPITAHTALPGLEQPVIHWTPSIAVCDMDFYFGAKFPRWQGDLFVTALAQQELRRLRVQNQRVVQQEVLFKNIGRVRDVTCAPDGMIYVALNKPDRIVRLEPVP